jgi:hypothetical protein
VKQVRIIQILIECVSVNIEKIAIWIQYLCGDNKHRRSDSGEVAAESVAVGQTSRAVSGGVRLQNGIGMTD